jgi:hypothetical protein
MCPVRRIHDVAIMDLAIVDLAIKEVGIKEVAIEMHRIDCTADSRLCSETMWRLEPVFRNGFRRDKTSLRAAER